MGMTSRRRHRATCLYLAALLVGSCSASGGGPSDTATAATAGEQAEPSPERAVEAGPPTPAPCPENATEPSLETGGFCGPEPTAGNGFASGGVCTGEEKEPPCGPGAEAEVFYSYSLPVTCDGLVHFDGRRWYAQITPPTNLVDTSPMFGWMRLADDGSIRFFGPAAELGLDLDVGQEAPGCGDR